MFTGIIREVGRIKAARREGENLRLVIEAPEIAPRLAIGGSVAVNGVCQTAVVVAPGTFEVDAVPETLARTTFGALRAGHPVNLEPPLAAGDPLDGHLVSGHVDAVAETVTLERTSEGGTVLTVTVPQAIARFVVEKGSIALDGVSLTVASRRADHATVALVPHTLHATTLGRLRRGDRLNVEVDLVARYLAGLLGAVETGEITPRWLEENGYGALPLPGQPGR
jgi:riboflavin synthase